MAAPFVPPPAAAAPAPVKRKIITAPRLWWKGAAKQVTKPRPVMRSRKRKSGESAAAALPWKVPNPDADMWADYKACKAAGLLGAWFERYRYVLNLKPLEPEP